MIPCSINCENHTGRQMSVPRFYILIIGCFCFVSISEALFSFQDLDAYTSLVEDERRFMNKLAELKNAYNDAKKEFGDVGYMNLNLFVHRDPEESMNASELITSKGYPCERHNVLTSDGFILGLQRIPHGLKDKKKNKQRPVAYLQHGLLGSSTNFLTNLANESLAFVLADAGYDVWLGNSRGNFYSRKHISIPITTEKFWAFSFDEMAQYDIPASLNYVTKYTRQKSVYYIGHSQGTLIGFMAFSQNKELAKKVRLMLAMGPVLTVAHMTSPIRLLTRFTDKELFLIFGKKDFLPENEPIRFLADTVCKFPATRFICLDVIKMIAGADNPSLNVSRLPVYLTHTPAGTSTRNMDHFAQNYRTGKCSKYDFGSKRENILHYGQPFPPEYNITDMDVPVALYSGSKDTLADPQDVKFLATQLKHLVVNKCIEGWGHLEFMWGVIAPQLYNQMIKLMKKF